MSADFSKFKNYYFMRCFSNEEYRDAFNNGEKIYINSTKYFHDLEDNFQQDFEGGVFRQLPNTRGILILSKSKITLNEAVEKVVENRFSNGELFFRTSDFKVYINGYIFCLTIIPKSYIEFRENEIVFNENHNIRDGFYHLLNQYTNDKGYTYVCVYDAEHFMRIFYESMSNRGYNICYGCIDYQSISLEEKIQYYVQHDIEKLVFTKDEQYSYQNEFRLFFQKTNHENPDHIEETGIAMQPSVVKDMVYLSPDYVEKLQIGN